MHAELAREARRPQAGRVHDRVRDEALAARASRECDLESAVVAPRDRVDLGVVTDGRAVALGEPRDARREQRRVDVAVLGRVDARLDVRDVDQRVERGDLVGADQARRERRIIVERGHLDVVLRLEQPVGVALLDDADRAREVQPHVVRRVHLGQQRERPHVQLFQFGAAAEARDEARGVPCRARAELARLLEQRHADAARRERSRDRGARRAAADHHDGAVRRHCSGAHAERSLPARECRTASRKCDGHDGDERGFRVVHLSERF